MCLAACAGDGDIGDTDSAQPAQPASGPGGSAYAHGDWRVSSGGPGLYGWYVFEPIDPMPSSAPLAIIIHGYGEYSGYDQMYELIRHTVRSGNVVIYPRWQTGLASPCLGPFDVEPCLTSTRVGIYDALDFLAGDGRVHPQLDRTSYFGFSFGGIITANLANRHAAWSLPVPRAIFLDDLHDGALDGTGEPALDDVMDGIPATTLVTCNVGEDGILATVGVDQSCNALFPLLSHIPDANKDLVLTHTDRHASRRADGARRTPTTGASCGRCGMRYAAARTTGSTVRTPSATRHSIARSGSGATACP
jgi:pimeloyl-ACP methyl ester carboxylesterase